ncbi:MAG TPA: hypothetical protein VMX57_08975 [Planctomycetota bacterium]|nr:hypothetical protein [Planctomycetota bacterium]
MRTKPRKNEPFLGIREVTLGDSSITHMEQCFSPLKARTGSVTPRIYQKYEIPNWDLPKLHAYLDMIKAFGFNSVQLYDQWESYLDAGWGNQEAIWDSLIEDGWRGEPRDWPAKVDAVGDYARAIGLRATIFIWGNTGFDARTGRAFWALCPNDPVEREVLEHYWEQQARHAAHFDHLVTHWGDPGGCSRNGCTIQTAQHCHNEIVARCRRHNANIESTFSLWMLDSKRFGKWPGYEGPGTILDSGILPDDVMLCVHGEPGIFDYGQIRTITNAGRRAGVWAWYLANNEIYPSMFVCTARLKQHFAGLPADAHERITWHSVDSNNHTVNLHNLYVASRLMLDPSTDASAALRDFTAGAFGTENAGHAARALEIIETLRPLWCEKYGREPLDVALAREADARAREIVVADDFEPAFPMPITPRELADEIVAQTDAMRAFAEFTAAVEGVRKMIEKGAPAGEVKTAVAGLPTVAKPTEYLTNLEYCHYLAIRADLDAAETSDAATSQFRP